MPDESNSGAASRFEIASLLHEQFARLSRQLRTLQLPQGMTPERLSALTVRILASPSSPLATISRSASAIGL